MSQSAIGLASESAHLAGDESSAVAPAGAWLSSEPIPADLALIDFLWQQKEWEGCVLECTRFLYNHKNHPWRFYVLYRGSLGYRNLNDYSEAMAWLKKAQAICPITELKPKMRYQLALTELLLGTENRAELEFLMMARKADSPILIANASLVQSVLAVNGKRWLEAEKAIEKTSILFGQDILSSQTTDDLHNLLSYMQEHPTTVNTAWAKRLSAILPGLGQLYIGEYANGFAAMGNFAFSTALVISSFGGGNILEGYFAMSILWLRSYFGARAAAEYLAIETNNKYAQNAANKFETILYKWSREQPPLVMAET